MTRRKVPPMKKSINKHPAGLHAEYPFLFKAKGTCVEKAKRRKIYRDTETEREYYSRVVKKRLSAIAKSEIRKIAAVLTKKH